MEKTVVCYLEKDHAYLMLYRNKKANDINYGKYIGIGGHIELNETKEEALLREVKEETGLTLLDFALRGTIYFVNEQWQEVMYLYTSNAFTGTLSSCDEGDLSWQNIDSLTNLSLWEGDKVFLKLLKENVSYFELKLIYQGDKLIDVQRLK